MKARHYIYRITCEENDSAYYGRHSLDLDEIDYYYGSGLWIKWATSKGLTLIKTILCETDTFDEVVELEHLLIREMINTPNCVNVYKEHMELSGRFVGEYHTPAGVFLSKRDAANAVGIAHSTLDLRCKQCDTPIKPNRWTDKDTWGKTWRQLGFYFTPKEEL